MSFTVSGLSPTPFRPLYGLSDDALAEQGVIRRKADAKPGYACRVTLRDAEVGEHVLLLNHTSHDVDTPYRSSYAIFVREGAEETTREHDGLPPALRGRPIALRLYSGAGMLVGADLGFDDDLVRKIQAALERSDVGRVHAHNAMHGCFVAEISRTP